MSQGTTHGTISLTQHGWDGQSIPATLVSYLQHLPTWRSLRVLRPPENYGTRRIEFPWDALQDASGIAFLPALEMGERLAEGSYGTVYRANRALYVPVEGSRYHRIRDYFPIVSKVHTIEWSPSTSGEEENREEYYEEEIQAILYESALHVFAYHTLKKAGHPTVIPELYDVLAVCTERHPEVPSAIQAIKVQMEYIAGETLHDVFTRQLLESTDSRQVRANDLLLCDILIQLCIYLDILQVSLRFNHRDLKINNVLRRRRESGWRRELRHEVLSEPWEAKQDLVIIDFGFSCIACGDTDSSSLVQAGSWFRPYHDCMKSGRDIALFLYCLHVYFPLQKRVSVGLWTVLRKAMEATWSTEVVSLLEVGVDKHGVPGQQHLHPRTFDAGIYRFLRHSSVDVPGCAPRTLMTELVALSKPTTHITIVGENSNHA